VATLTQIRQALASQIQTYCVNPQLRAQAEPLDQGVGPVALIVPGSPYIKYGDTFADSFNDLGQMQFGVCVNLCVLILVSDSSTADREQQQLDAFLDLGTAADQISVPMAIQMDPTLGGIVMSTIPIQVGHYGRVPYGGLEYFGARLEVQVLA
jgi:hypothetical protein